MKIIKIIIYITLLCFAVYYACMDNYARGCFNLLVAIMLRDSIYKEEESY